ncbi:hypothetical protein SAMN05443245_3410 [Paraburkholderia fungorum]|uniref:Uncharacterized protein n=1 Tax=Paraburkholderia fungorum TaxID=134537 RepID=A0A1H1GZU2_9BURK|nr:hypothetical protein [Paraburkholderia fungorum]SDR18690.1 hypothetical protein SAMN05443245_3410 [Paraburkholderia fungorum]
MNARTLARAIAFDIFLGMCLYLWLVRGNDGARVLAIGYLGFLTAFIWIAALFVPAEKFERGYVVNAAYDIVSTLAVIVVLACNGEPWLAIALLIPYIVTLAKREAAKA